MNMFFIRSIFHLKLLIILKCIAAASATNDSHTGTPVSTISVICCIDTGVTFITELPLECTAIASYATNAATSPNSIEILRKDRKLPYVYIIDDYSYDDMVKNVEPDAVECFIDTISKTIGDVKADAVLFDNINSGATSGSPDTAYEEGLVVLFKGIRSKNPSIKILLEIPKDEAQINHGFNRQYLDPAVDFYVADTVLYHDCVRKNHEADMANMVPLNELSRTMIMLDSMGFSPDKLIIILRVVVRSVKDSSSEDISYTDMCSEDKISDERKFCVDTLPNFYQKGALVYQHKMKAVMIQSPDRDDYAGKCGKVKFPALKAIVAGINGEPEPLDVTSAKYFAVLPRDRPNNDGISTS